MALPLLPVLLGAAIPPLIQGGIDLFRNRNKPDQSSQGMLPTMGGQGNALTGYSAATQQLPRYTPEQQALINSLIPHVQQGLQQKSDFAPIAEQARRSFSTKTVPSIAERFTAMGGGQRSSAFQGALGQAASDLETNLAALGSGHALQQQALLQNLLGHALSPSFENIYIPQTSGLFGSLAAGAGASLPFLSLLSGIGSTNTTQAPQINATQANALSALLQNLQASQSVQNVNRLGGGAQRGLLQGYTQIQG